MREWKAHWWERGKCRNIVDPEVFMRPRNSVSVKGNNESLVDPWSHARKVCEGCPVQLECLEFVMEEEVRVVGHDSKSFAAGMTPMELRELKHRWLRTKGRL